MQHNTIKHHLNPESGGVGPLDQNPWLSLEQGAWTWPWKISNVLLHHLRKALQIVTIARVSTMEDDAARVRVYPCYQCQNLYGSSTMFDTFKLRWFPLFDFTPLNVWTDEGQPCDYSASCSILPAFRMCTHAHTHTITQLVWGFRYLDTSYPDKGRLIQKSIVCRKFTAGARTPSTARRVSRVVRWGHGQGFRVDTNWHTTSNTSFHHENNGIMTLIIIAYHWQQHFWNIWKIAYIPIIFQALCGPWILDRSTALRDNDFRIFRWGSVFQEKPGSTFPVPERCWGPRCREEVLPTPTGILWLWNLVMGNPAFTVDFPIETLGFHGQATLLEDVHFRSWIIDDHNMT